jgi:hypothetical protein
LEKVFCAIRADTIQRGSAAYTEEGNTSTVIPVSRKGRQKGNLVVSDETVMYGYESSETLTTDRLHYKLQTILSSERAS